MSLERRLVLYLLVCAPLVWIAAMAVSIQVARHSVNELFDTHMIQLAQQVQAVLASTQPGSLATQPLPMPDRGPQGEADLRDLALAVWDAQGRLVLADREGAELPRRTHAAGFVDEGVNGDHWRVYYLPSPSGKWLVAAAQKSHERDELVFSLTATQMMPWLLVLPVLLAAMAWGIRRALAPVHGIARELQGRSANDLKPVAQEDAPAEIRPLLRAMNGLFSRAGQAMARERRFTADAAHELRTPLAVLRAQWDVVRRSAVGAERVAAETKFSAGLDRMDRLVTQMLALSRLESTLASGSVPPLTAEVHWPRIVEQVISDCLPLAEERRIEIACDWPVPAGNALPMMGDEHLLAILLRNLLDNAVRYAPNDSLVTLRFSAQRLEVENAGPQLEPEHLARMGERFHRPDGQQKTGSGLGVSIVQRIAALHGLRVSFGPRPDGTGMRVTLAFPPARPHTGVAA